MTFDNSLKVFIISVDNSHTTLLEQHRFASEIIIKILMLVWSDMIWFNIGKDTIIKNKSLCTVKHQSLGRNFHNYTVTSCIYHFTKIFLHQIRFRSCVACRNGFFSNDRFDGSDQSNFVSCIFENGFYHICCGSFSFCSGNSNRFQFLRRMSKICSGNKGHRITGICNFDHSYIFRCFYLFFNNECFRTFLDHIRYKFVSIHNRTANADKQGIFFYFSGVIYNCRDFLFCAALTTDIFQTFQ